MATVEWVLAVVILLLQQNVPHVHSEATVATKYSTATPASGVQPTDVVFSKTTTGLTSELRAVSTHAVEMVALAQTQSKPTSGLANMETKMRMSVDPVTGSVRVVPTETTVLANMGIFEMKTRMSVDPVIGTVAVAPTETSVLAANMEAPATNASMNAPPVNGTVTVAPTETMSTSVPANMEAPIINASMSGRPVNGTVTVAPTETMSRSVPVNMKAPAINASMSARPVNGTVTGMPTETMSTSVPAITKTPNIVVRPTTIHARSAEIEMMTIPMTEMRLTQTAMSPPLTTHFLNVRTISHAMTETSVVNGETPEIMRITSMSLQPLYTTAVTLAPTEIRTSPHINECQSFPCQHAGVCIDEVAAYTCVCIDGFSGPNCEIDINECVSKPCQNGANCTDVLAGYICHCVDGFNGSNCEIDIDECKTMSERCKLHRCVGWLHMSLC
jgi:hypothetical protein